jgi:uncharacterized protein (TIGR03083 family)
MVLDREWLLGVARQEREGLGRAIQYTRPDAWERPSPWRGRPVADVLCHLAASEIAAAAVYGGENPAELEEFRKALGDEDFTIEGWNDWSVARRAEQSPVTTGLEWGRAANLLLARASKTSDEEWRERALPWLGAELRAGYLIQSRVVQWWLHGQDIRIGGGQEIRREHPPTYAVNDFAIRLIPYALSLAGEDLPGLTVEVELEEVGGGTWLQATEAGLTPDPEAQPDVIIQGRGSWFALVATHRMEPDVALYEGNVNVGGDVSAGEVIVRTLRAFP